MPDMSSPMIGSPTAARVAAVVTLIAYAAAVCLPAFLLWFGWNLLDDRMLELELPTRTTVQR